MNDASRRSFLALAGLGTAAGVAAAAVPAAAATPKSAEDDVSLPRDASGPMVVYVNDVTKGELALMIEGHEVVVHDKRLVARIAGAYARA